MAIDHFKSRSIAELAAAAELVTRLKALLPLPTVEGAVMDALLIKLDESVRAKRQAGPIPLPLPRMIP